MAGPPVFTLGVGDVNQTMLKALGDAGRLGSAAVTDTAQAVAAVRTAIESRPANPVTIADFETFCAVKGIRIARRVHLAGDWHTPCRLRPNLLAGYALYDLAR